MGAAPRVDRLAVEMQELATTMRLPLGEPMLVGGMTYLTPPLRQTNDSGSDSTEPQADSSETPQLYLVLEIQ
jgi:hypothetical protein